MSVSPYRLNRVTANALESNQFKCLGGEGPFWVFVKIAHNVLLPFAAGARTALSQFFERNEALAAILPLDGQFLADLLYIQGTHTLISSALGAHNSFPDQVSR